MKNLLIAGVAKSGKSTFCNLLCETNKYNHIPFDYFTAAMKRNYPQWGIKSDVIINETSEKLCKLINTISSIIDDKEEKFIIDTAHIMPRDIINNINRNNWDIYFFGYPNIDVEEKLLKIRESEHNDWTQKKTDEELKECLVALMEISKVIKEECEQFSIKFIDTSHDFNNTLNFELKYFIDKTSS